MPAKSVRKVSPIWLTIFSDMVTNLTLFFMMMYAFTRVSETERMQFIDGLQSAISQDKKAEMRAESVLRKLRTQETASAIEEISKHEEFAKYAKLDISEQFVKITLETPVLFNIGSAELNPKMLKILDDIARIIKLLPNRIIIEGHTDNLPVTGGKYSSNWELSIARALSVLEYFTVVKGLPAEKFTIAGYGEYKPIAPNDTEENRSLNRRIEIYIVK
jgi:chemotaxis protein MotB